MLKISMVPVLTKMISKLDLKPIVEKLKTIDIFENGQAKVTPEQAAALAFELLTDITPQLHKIGVDLPEFVALYKGVSLEEANEFDLAEIINDIKNDEGILSFFKCALRQKAGRGT